MPIQWKYGGAHYVADCEAEVAYKELLRIKRQNGNLLQTQVVVEEAEKKRSPLHFCLEWDDSVAGHEFRLRQARSLVNHLVIVDERSSQTRGDPCFVNVKIDNDTAYQGYVRTEEALTDKQMRRQVLNNALRDLRVWERRYNHLDELAKVFDASHAVHLQYGEDPDA